MIYSNDFVWLHFPKCAGTKVERIFQKYFATDPTIVQDPTDFQIDPEVRWHDSISMRSERNPSFQLGERTVICSFRRLPAWLISRYSFEHKRSPALNHRPELLLKGQFLEMNGNPNSADFYCNKYLPPSILESARLRFLRTEYFERDFKSIFGEFLDLSSIPESAYKEKVNRSSSSVPWQVKWKLHGLSHFVYRQCPRWKEIENLAYGHK